jgi:hypothetical protein
VQRRLTVANANLQIARDVGRSVSRLLPIAICAAFGFTPSTAAPLFDPTPPIPEQAGGILDDLPGMFAQQDC